MRTLIAISILSAGAPVAAQNLSKAGRVELTPCGFATFTDRFVNHAGGGLMVGYHFSDLLGVEVFSSVPGAVTGRYSDMVFELYDYESLTPETVDLKQIDYVGGLAVHVSPLWGEGEMYGVLLGYHLYVIAGVGLVRTLEICTADRGECSEDVGIGVGVQRPEEASEANRVAGHLGFGLRLALSDWIGARVEVRDVMFGDRHEFVGIVTEEFKHNVLLMAGLSLLL